WDAFADEPALPALPAIPPPPAAVSAYSFAASTAEPAAADELGIDPDLAEVFASEARATLDALDTTLAALIRSPDDRALLRQIERGFHTIKGAAATIGLDEVSQRAAKLHDRAELLIDFSRPVTGDEATRLSEGAAELRRLARLAAPAGAD